MVSRLYLAFTVFFLSAIIGESIQAQSPKGITSVQHEEKKSSLSSSDFAKARTYFSKGELLVEAKPDSALQLFQSALKTLSSSGASDESLKAQIYAGMGHLFFTQSVFLESISNYQEALLIAKKIENPHFEALWMLRMGEVYHLAGRKNEAVENFRNALGLFEEQADSLRIAEALGFIGYYYEKESAYDDALSYQKRAQLILEGINAEKQLAKIYDNIGSIYEDLDEYDTARIYFEKSYNLNKKYEQWVYLARNLNDLGDARRGKGKYEEAIEYTKKALKLAQEHNIAYEEKMAYYDLGKTYVKIQRFEEAYAYMKKAYLMHTEIYEDENQNRLTQMQALFEVQKKDKQLLAGEAEVQRQRLLTNSFIAASLLILLLAFVLYRSNRTKHKKNIALHTQKESILKQNEALHDSNLKIEEQRNEIEEKNRQLTGSIRYALTIEKAILPRDSKFTDFFSEFFVLYKPKDIVSGDFYWTAKAGNNIFAAVVDCTGHGVPGAFMTMIGNTLLNKIVNRDNIYDPARILYELREDVEKALQQSETDNRDGMDMSLCRITIPENEEDLKLSLAFAGAKLPLLIYRSKEKEAELLKGDRASVGGILTKRGDFHTKNTELSRGDVLYMFSDGFSDQNNVSREKVGSRKFRDLLTKGANLPLTDQHRRLSDFLQTYTIGTDQRDDITVMGIRL